MSEKSISVLIIDDSAVVRKVFRAGLDREPDINVIGVAADPFIARDLLQEIDPDVILLDIEMPRMDGLTFLRKLMRYKPTPVVIVSTLTTAGSEIALEAMESGAVEVVCKPGGSYGAEDLGRWLGDKVRAAAAAGARGLKRAAPRKGGILTVDKAGRGVIAIGSSTGGTDAVATVLSRFPSNCPGTLVAQHMPPCYTEVWAASMNKNCQPEIREAKDGDQVFPGVVLIAPGDYHMVLHREGSRYTVRLNQGPKVCHQRPSCDVLFDSVAKHAGPHAVGVIMTGMGADGAKGLLAMSEAGATTFAQDEASCVVFGMPKKAIEIGAAQKVVTLGSIAEVALRASEKVPADTPR